MSFSFLSYGFSDVRVLNAFKVEHKALSKKIQVSICLRISLARACDDRVCLVKPQDSIVSFHSSLLSKYSSPIQHLLLIPATILQRAANQITTNGKVKGLFCLLPRNGVFGFSAYGLYSQDLGNDLVQESSASDLRDLFQLPWFSAELSGSSEAVRVGERALRDNKRPDSPLGARASSTKIKSHGTAETLARANCCLNLRFSKYSNPLINSSTTPRDQETDQQKESDEGSILALCRVLIKKVHYVDGDLSPPDIREALLTGCDAIYSRLRYAGSVY